MNAPELLRRRTREAPEVRRARILDEAIGLIGERGYYGFTVQELAGRCGLTNPGLLHYFRSKHDILLAALGEMEAREILVFAPIVQAAERDLPGNDAHAGVLEVFRAIVRRGTANPAMIRFLAELQTESLDPNHPAHGWCLRREAVMLELFARLLQPFVASSSVVARHLIALMDGLFVQWLRAWPSLDIIAEWNFALARMLPELHDRGADIDLPSLNPEVDKP